MIEIYYNCTVQCTSQSNNNNNNKALFLRNNYTIVLPCFNINRNKTEFEKSKTYFIGLIVKLNKCHDFN